MKIGMISFAHMHAFSYARHLLEFPEVEIAAIWDEDQELGTEMANTFNCLYFSNLDQLLDSDIDAVVVCSENGKHKDHVIAAARAGKHILCEKPIATEVVDAKAMIDACEEFGVILQVAYPVRFAPAIQKVREYIRSGTIGEVVAINGTNHGQMPGGWFIEKELSGGGAATDHIVHVMDLIRWILNDEVKNVYAELDTRFYSIDVEDCGMVTLELESGVIVSIDPSWSRPKTFPTWGDVLLEFVGTKGTLSVDTFKQHSTYYNDVEGKVQHLSTADDMDKGLIEDFLQSIKEKRLPSITGEDGLRTLEVVKAAYESDKQKKVVTLNRI
ncbi:dehydrogenase [Bacillus sp. AFS076308]|uniref:Gfo/Idh/MocA family protein n=1 Tax=unclassified Bacillus (in: firmicutes) TaxID=185979 RepID=UPI000BF2D759|nr:MULTISPECIES: Gfo/Idh/MocA family oxidoreductase [unclassified Bacillus (in: firmicutes)]PFO09333.1 dehydrogenase [Bacillus sp. AFS076308]PGV50311.1 dehydrogenase [Bacillus sp. AFS037270]